MLGRQVLSIYDKILVSFQLLRLKTEILDLERLGFYCTIPLNWNINLDYSVCFSKCLLQHLRMLDLAKLRLLCKNIIQDWGQF